jgi:hypothetical protein
MAGADWLRGSGVPCRVTCSVFDLTLGRLVSGLHDGTGDAGTPDLNYGDIRAPRLDLFAGVGPVAATATPPCTRLGASVMVAEGAPDVEEFCTAGHFIAQKSSGFIQGWLDPMRLSVVTRDKAARS